MRASVTAPVVEIFSSIQGEGECLGERHVFLRLGECNLRCEYCDTKESWSPQPTFTCETAPGSGKSDRHENPAHPAYLLELLGRFPCADYHAVSVTGGEPLLHPGFLRLLLPGIKESGHRVLLETNGTLPEALAEVAEWVDIVSADVKLPLSPEGGEFIRAAARARERSGCRVYVKVVVTASTPVADVTAAVTAASADSIPVVLQPVSYPAPASERDFSPIPLLSAARRVAPDVRLIPQVHKLAGWR